MDSHVTSKQGTSDIDKTLNVIEDPSNLDEPNSAGKYYMM